jgi:hypothetical protein
MRWSLAAATGVTLASAVATAALSAQTTPVLETATGVERGPAAAAMIAMTAFGAVGALIRDRRRARPPRASRREGRPS